MAGRKTKPAEGERCLRGHDPSEWYQQESTQKWICRRCAKDDRKSYHRHIKITQPERYKKWARDHDQRVIARRRREREERRAQEQQLPPEDH